MMAGRSGTEPSRERGGRAAWILGVLAAAAPGLLALLRCLRARAPLAGHDFALEFIPWWKLAQASLRQGRLPWWDAATMAGCPFLADPQSALLYPPNWLFLLGPVPAILAISTILHLWLGGGFTWAWLRARGLGRPACLLGGLVYANLGFLSIHVGAGHLTIIHAAAWLPAVLWQGERLRRTRRGRHLLGAAAAGGLQLLAGHPQTSLITLLALALLLAERSWLRPGLLAWGVGAVLLALAITAGPVLLGAELVAESPRSGDTDAAFGARSNPLPPENLVQLLLPDLLGGTPERPYRGRGAYHETFNYLGMITLLLALLPASGRRRDLLLLLGAGLALAILPGLPGIGPLWVRLPGIGLFRGWARGMLLGGLALAALAAQGWDGLLRGEGSLRRVRTGGLALVGLVVAVWLLHPVLASRAAQGWMIPGRSLAFLLGGLGLTLLASGGRFRVAATVLLPLLLAADLGGHSVRYLRPQPDPSEMLIQRIRELESRLREPPGARLAIPGAPELISLFPFLPADSVVGYRALPLGRFEDFLNLVRGEEIGTSQVYATVERPGPLLRMAGLRWWLAPPAALEPEGLAPVAALGNAVLYEDPRALPRAWVAGAAEVIPGRRERLARLASPGWDPRRSVILESEVPLPGNAGGGMAPARYLREEGGAARIRVDSRGGYLVVSDAYYPGWRATLDGHPVEIHRANHLFRAVAIPGGRHEVILRYEPGFRRWALACSLLGLVAAGAILLGWRRLA